MNTDRVIVDVEEVLAVINPMQTITLMLRIL